MQLAKRKRKNKDGRLRSQRHLRFVRGHKCLVDGCGNDQIEAHHVGETATSAMGLKPSDEWAVPLCMEHHKALHDMGVATFTREALSIGSNFRDAALWFARRSPDQAIKDAVRDHE